MGSRRLQITVQNGVRLFGNLHEAKDSREMVVVCHGFGKTWNKNRLLYRSICEAFQSEGVNAFRFSFRGISPSGGRPEDSSYTAQQEDIGAVISALKKRMAFHRVVLIAHSIGGISATLQTAGDRRIRHLMLIAPRIMPRISLVARGIESLCGARLEAVLEWPDKLFPIGPVVIGDAPYYFGRRFVEDIVRVDMLDELCMIRVPITIFRGELDTRIAEAEVRRAVTSNPLARYISLPQSGHSFGNPLQREALISALIRAFHER